MASVFDRIEEKIEYITWEDVYRMGFKDSQTISPWYRYFIEVSHPILGTVYENMAMFFPERKAHPILGPSQDEPSRLSFKSTINGEYQHIVSPTTEDLEMVMAIIRQVASTY